MDLIKDFRTKEFVTSISTLIKENASSYINIMEVCGGHTHSIMKYALPELFGKNINFIHGPGCPVCIMPRVRIDEGIELALQENVIFCTLGDMIRVPGSKYSLADVRAKGADVRALYSPFECIEIAQKNESKTVIFYAIGFETTAPMTAALMERAKDIKNLFFHINHVTVPAPIHSIMQDKDVKIDAFLAPSHVSVITGSDMYEPIASMYKRPIAISGFEPLDIAHSVLNLVLQHKNKTHEVFNQYKRAVRVKGNTKAKELVEKYFKLSDFEWRGLGVIPNSALELREEYAHLNAKKLFQIQTQSKKDNKACICGDILKGHKKPKDCSVFAKACNPKNPIGACMVSSEGACAAYFKYQRMECA